MPDNRGGARPGAGRPRNAHRFEALVSPFTLRCAEHLDPAFAKLWELVDGARRVERKYQPAGTVTRKDVARDAEGNPIRDDRGRLTQVEVRVYPEAGDGELVLVEEKRATLTPDVHALKELFARAIGLATAAPEPEEPDGPSLPEAFEQAVEKFYPEAQGPEGESPGG